MVPDPPLLGPIMSHTNCGSHDLNRIYPLIVIPADERTEDFVDDGAGDVLRSGVRIPDGIRQNMISKGQTRWRDDQGVGLVSEFGLSQPNHRDDVLIGDYGPHGPTHT